MRVGPVVTTFEFLPDTGISVRKIQYKLHEYGAAPKSAVPVVRNKGSNGGGKIEAG